MLVPFPMPFTAPASGVAPPTHGLSLDRVFFSLDAQAGRPVVLALIGRAAPDPARPAFLRWLVFVVANIYPTFTYADEPSRFVADEAAQPGFRAKVNDYARFLWRSLESAAGAPWFLGTGFSALDIYIAVMTKWRPQRPWFATDCPRLHAIAMAAEARPEYAASWRWNFPVS